MRLSGKMILLFLGLILPLSLSHARTPKIYNVGISTWTGYPDNIKGFKKSMKSGGLIEGKNVRCQIRQSGGDREQQIKIAHEFNRAKVDLVYSLTTPGTTIIKDILPENTPIVFSIVTYPADSGLIESFEYSGNNLVGTSNYVPLKNYVKLLQWILPQTKNIAIFHRKGEPNSKIQAVNLIRLLKGKGIHSFDQTPSTVEEIEQMTLSLVGKVDAFITTTDTLMQGGGEMILIKISKQWKIPILSSNKMGIELGSTFGPVVDFHSLGEMSGEMALKILNKNTDPARLESKLQDPPIILINRKSLRLMGISLSKKGFSRVHYID